MRQTEVLYLCTNNPLCLREIFISLWQSVAEKNSSILWQLDHRDKLQKLFLCTFRVQEERCLPREMAVVYGFRKIIIIVVTAVVVIIIIIVII